MTDAATTGDRVMIRLQGLTKRYPGQGANAVDALDLDIHEGEIVVLVGPSGCGKTTTMKMINRIIEPSGGRILLDGEDVTTTDPDRLRRRIGYVIQQIGLFPHMTIGENIATVPKLLGWDAARIDRRVDELMRMVSMPPEEYRHRYPKQLSGGQQQRIGVARALGADPDVLLMDEPFGAIDPITRDRLQNELLRLQSEVRKTIVFVTHDIDEAIKLGDRIAILQEGSRVAQYDTPEQILTAPANPFVSDFIGRGASLKRLNLTHVADIQLRSWPTVPEATDPAAALDRLRDVPESALLVLDGSGTPARWVGAADLRRATGPDLAGVGSPISPAITPRATLSDALNELITARHSVAIVTGDDGALLGVVDIDQINEAIREMRASAVSAERSGLREGA
ncbi:MULTISPECIES: ABC transporter ATP-binding protein [unclassified Pseudactinotalea]|uniref:ABC transporter ATP-binding protein n=1 Tax=unclassified Pseudactinotalea TaxID=2649176 RepID=UPI00128C9128|nr:MULTISPECIES: betaine/proline/choline family ABC transporter ATP-binding protein [unclassified Pseudactinotalea]MPV49252.1 betaine/proline/choline family ABC transporter ATP-binding protein [Pseudactinotalea sp. HY160]QGH69450.1 betaine/proline/choline family ABC transporter ATP-binding protein [Pseudactinotalea sp. HY158]